MKYNNIFDAHTHSDNSFDGHHSCVLLCEGAIQNNGIGIAITDHCDIDVDDFDFRAFSINQYVESFMAKKCFEGKIEVLQGIELGQSIYRKEKSQKILNEFDYDFILGSLHNVENKKDYCYLDYSSIDVDDLLTEYFDELYKVCEFNQFDSLAHLTYPLRYIYSELGIRVDLSKYDDIITKILKKLIENNKALELNVSGLFMPLEDTLPSKDILIKYKELGGKYVTVGSDSHYYEKVCLGIEKGYDILKECGFDYFTIFRKRKPYLIPIE